MSAPKILAIETSTDACSAALFFENHIRDRFMIAPASHTKCILPMIDELLAGAKLDYKKLDAIAFGHGPGSFTGVRLAASIAQGLAFASGIPVIGVSSLRALAQEVFVEYGARGVLVAQDARMQEVYWGEYEVDSYGIMQAITPDKLIKPSEAMSGSSPSNFVGVGNGFETYKNLFVINCLQIVTKQYVQAKYVVQLAATDFVKSGGISAEKGLPIYLREKVAWV